jgi:hypothetical protein
VSQGGIQQNPLSLVGFSIAASAPRAQGYDEPEILPSSIHPICLKSADGGHKDGHHLIKRCNERCLIDVECVEITDSGEDARHPGRGKRRSSNEVDIVRIWLNERYDGDRHAAEQRRGYDNRSDTLVLEVFRQQKLVIMIGAGKKKWSPQGDEEPALVDTPPGTVLKCG